MPIIKECPNCKATYSCPLPTEIFFSGDLPKPPEYCEKCGTLLITAFNYSSSQTQCYKRRNPNE